MLMHMLLYEDKPFDSLLGKKRHMIYYAGELAVSLVMADANTYRKQALIKVADFVSIRPSIEISLYGFRKVSTEVLILRRKAKDHGKGRVKVKGQGVKTIRKSK
ncbi:hypothetical protein RND81_03G158600 [Saponaria officinalis]|uniref:Uncharacterized protein n=1 Tax=Saponaria officinalis TaxID=3572 RepID=A0AAW1M8N6_SAPOF